MLLKIILALASFHLAALQGNSPLALPNEFFNSLTASIAKLKLYQTRVSEDLLQISLALEQTLAVYEILDLEGPIENQTEIKQELVDQIKELKGKCWTLVASFQKAHRDLIFKHDILNKRELDYQSAVTQASLKPLPDTLKKISEQLKLKFIELAETIFDKDLTKELKKRVVQQKQFQDEINNQKTQQQTLLKCLGNCKKSLFISKKNAELTAKIKTLETFVKKLESERKAFLNKYGAASIDDAISILNLKQTCRQKSIAELTIVKQAEYNKFIQIDFLPLTNEQNMIFFSAKKCIENYTLVLEDIIYIASKCGVNTR